MVASFSGLVQITRPAGPHGSWGVASVTVCLDLLPPYGPLQMDMGALPDLGLSHLWVHLTMGTGVAGSPGYTGQG